MSRFEKSEVLNDFKLLCLSRHASLAGRKEVLTGKAKFGIFGDGKELAQIALAKVCRPGDWRSGYYRDQTLMMALNLCNLKQFFAQLFADTDINHDPYSAGRQMNNHFATPVVDKDGNWLSQFKAFNSSSDISPTGGQMARLLGLGYASKLYRNNKRLKSNELFSKNGDEVAFGMIGNASTSEGLFWECMNATAVLQVPIVMSVWDDDYGISVPNEFQTAKGSISEALKGFNPDDKSKKGMDIYVVKGWDYEALIDTYAKATEKTRRTHVPSLVHVIEMTQPQGHSTSGSHERYKTKERLAYEEKIDCLVKLREWILERKFASAAELDEMENSAKNLVEKERAAAWDEYLKPIEADREQLLKVLDTVASQNPEIASLQTELKNTPSLFRRNIQSVAKRAMIKLRDIDEITKRQLINFISSYEQVNAKRYSSYYMSETTRSPLHVPEVKPTYSASSPKVDARQVIQKFFDVSIERDPRIFAIGEDIGKLGGVNLEFDGLQEKYSDLHVTDTGIREATILGQGMGAAIRGLRPIVDIQYLDYLLFCFQGLSDDLASLHYRSAGQQIAPVIVRTKGHRLEGIWHTGSPMGMILHGIRGMHVCVPRNMTQAAGMYKTLLQGDDPALVIEVLNGLRIKEVLPDNTGDYTVPLGVPEIIQEGNDITLVTYGACVRVAQEGIKLLEEVGISVELIDVQTLLPFDRFSIIKDSIAKTNAVVFMDEDVPGGATGFMLQQVMDEQKAFDLLDIAPRTLAAKPHRSAYASDGDYFSKPNPEDVFEIIYDMMRSRAPHQFSDLRS